MTLQIITFDNQTHIVDCISFEFRCNTVDGWFKGKTSDGETIFIDRVCMVKWLR